MGHAVAREPVGGAGWRGDGTIVNLHSHRPQSLRRLLLPWALLAAVLLYASSSADPVEAAGPLAAGDQAVISADGDGLNLRQTPALDGVILAFAVPDGTVVTARGEQYMADGICWEAVTHDGQPGWMAAEYLVPVGGEADDDADPCADAERVDEPSVLPAPPPGGWTQGVAGTSDIEALVAAQTFDVQSVWALDLATQDFQSYIPGAPAFVNNPGVSSLRPDSVVMMLRRGERPDELPGAPVAGGRGASGRRQRAADAARWWVHAGRVRHERRGGTRRLAALRGAPDRDARRAVPDLADLHPGSSPLRAVPDARPAAARLDRLGARGRGAGARTDGDAGARTDGDAGARTDGDAGARTDGDAGARTDGDAGARTDSDAGARADRDAGRDHSRGEDHLLLLQPGDNFGRHRRRWRVV